MILPHLNADVYHWQLKEEVVMFVKRDILDFLIVNHVNAMAILQPVIKIQEYVQTVQMVDLEITVKRVVLVNLV